MLHRRHEAVAILSTIVALASLSACSSEELAVPASDVVGPWSGSTSQTEDLEFTVSDEGIASGVFGYRMTGQCNFTTAHTIAGAALTISRGKFSSGKTEIGQGAFVTVAGEFTSSTNARGTLLIEHGPCADTLDLSWTATKN